RLLRWYRRPNTVGLVGLAILFALPDLLPARAPTTGLVVAARDLPAGHLLTAADLRTLTWAGPSRPPLGSRSDPSGWVGRIVAGPVAAGELLTETRLVGPALGLPGTPGIRVVTVRLADSADALLARPGGLVDLIAAYGSDAASPEGTTGARVVATRVRVLAVVGGSGAAEDGPSVARSRLLGAAVVSGSPSPTALLIAVDQTTAVRLADAATTARLSLAALPAPG
ncbi:MAG: Flp pilus assembly protein CpaB, partial [Acidimicrobiales bacterium]